MKYLIIRKKLNGSTDIAVLEAEGKEHSILMLKNSLIMERVTDKSIDVYEVGDAFGVDLKAIESVKEAMASHFGKEVLSVNHEDLIVRNNIEDIINES